MSSPRETSAQTGPAPLPGARPSCPDREALPIGPEPVPATCGTVRDHLPPGSSPIGNQAGWGSSLAKPAALIQAG
jgi:hypothetical protein